MARRHLAEEIPRATLVGRIRADQEDCIASKLEIDIRARLMDLLDFFGNDPRQAIDGGILIRVEKKLDLILNHLGLEFEPLTDEVRRAADDGNKILAIKLYRQETGLGLAQAKKDVEDYMRNALP